MQYFMFNNAIGHFFFLSNRIGCFWYVIVIIKPYWLLSFNAVLFPFTTWYIVLVGLTLSGFGLVYLCRFHFGYVTLGLT